jgi:hypothetical protein
MFGLMHSSTLRLQAVEPNAALVVIKSASFSLNMEVFWGGLEAVSGEGDGRLDDL